jgi:hypothetical protein
VQLASALLRFSESFEPPSGVLALTRPSSRTAERVRRLLGQAGRSEPGWRLALRITLALALAHAALLSRFLN